MQLVNRTEMIEQLLKESPFIYFLGLEIINIDLENSVIVMKMPLRPEFERGGSLTGQFHGGAIYTVGDFAIALVVGAAVPTINFRVDFLRPSTGAFLIAKATVRRSGKTVGVADVDIFDNQDRLTAIGRGCYSTQAG